MARTRLLRRVGLVALISTTTIGLSFVPAQLFAQPKDRYEAQRAQMVTEFIEREGVKNPRVLEAMRSVPRHEFVPSNLRKYAYDDTALAIGHQQTISPPFIVAYMTEMIDPQPDDAVLEIGTGSGYQAAVLSGLVKDVYTIEIVEPLGKAAGRLLEKLDYKNVHAKVGDGYAGWPEHAPFDKIIVTCSPENVPQPLIEQLKEGGKMIIPLGERYQQVFHLLEKQDGKLVETSLMPTLFVPMTGESEAQRRVKPDPARPQIVNGSFESDEDRNDLADGWHYQRQTKLVTDDKQRDGQYVRLESGDPDRIAQLLQGMAVDGRQIGSIRLSAEVQYELSTTKGGDKPRMMIIFYDAVRRPIEEGTVGPWAGKKEWGRVSAEIAVPERAREAIVRVTMGSATGSLCIDDVTLTPQRRR